MEFTKKMWNFLRVFGPLLLLCLGLANSECPTCSGDCKTDNLNLVFVVDGSGSICNNRPGPCRNWDYILDFMVDSIQYLDISPVKDRVGVVQFSDTGNVQFGLTDNTDSTSVRSAIRGMVMLNQRTNTSGGLYKMRTVMNQVPPDGRKARKVAIVITDGVSTLDSNRTIPEAQMAKDENITIYSIGVTNMIDQNEVRQISSDPQVLDTSYFTISDFTKFRAMSFIESIHSTVCKKYDPNPSVVNCPGASTSSGCYVVNPTRLSRPKAQVACAQTAVDAGRPGMGQLVSILSQAKHEEMEWFIEARWKRGLTPDSVRRYWIGGHRNSAIFGGRDFTVWTWVNSTTKQVVGPQGCFADGPTTSEFPVIEKFDSLSPQNCSAFCSARNYTIMGLKNGNLCLCGNNYGNYGRDSDCLTTCPGEFTSLCGGPNSVNIHIIAGGHGWWSPNQPNGFNRENQACGALEGRDDSASWRMGDELCYEKFPYICSVAGVPEGYCVQDNDNDIRRLSMGPTIESKCLLISKDLTDVGRKTWFEAQQTCVEKGGELLVLESMDEHAKIRDILNQDLGFLSMNDIWFWVGFVGKQWMWPSGSNFLFTNWGPDKPDNYGANCLTFEARSNEDRFYWTDERCQIALPSICAIDMTSPLPETTTTVPATPTTTLAPIDTTTTGNSSSGGEPPDTGASTAGDSGGLSVTLILIIVLCSLVVVGIICGVVACWWYNKKGKEQKVVPKADITSNILVPYNQYYDKNDDYHYKSFDERDSGVYYSNIPETDSTDGLIATTKPERHTVGFTSIGSPVPLPRPFEHSYQGSSVHHAPGNDQCACGNIKCACGNVKCACGNVHVCETQRPTGVVMAPQKLGKSDHAYISYTTGDTVTNGGTGVMEARNHAKYGKRAKNYNAEGPTIGIDSSHVYSNAATIDRYGATPDRYGATPDRYGATPDRYGGTNDIYSVNHRETYVVQPQTQMTSTMKSENLRSSRMTSRESSNLGLSLDGTRISIN